MTDSELCSLAVRVITRNEGNYASVVKNDSGAMGMGIFGFHGANAGQLLCNIVRAGGQAAQWIVELCKTGNRWAQRPATDAEVLDLRAAITTQIGRQCQDALAASYVSGNVKRAKNAGLRDAGAILYYCDFANQYGPASGKLKALTSAAVQNGGTLDAMLAATKNVTTQYLKRREQTCTVIRQLLAEQDAAERAENEGNEIRAWTASVGIDGELPACRTDAVSAEQLCRVLYRLFHQ